MSAALFLFCFAATVSAGAGVAALALWPQAASRASGVLEAAAGGALLVMGAAYLAPEALHLHGGAWVLVLAGLILGPILHKGADALFGAQVGALSLIGGLGLHSLLDGAAFAIALSADPVFGLGSAVGLVLHDAPKALFALVLLRRAGLGNGAAAAGAMLVAAGFTALGALGAAPLAGGLPQSALGGLTGLAGGLLIYSGLACLMTLRRPPVPAKAAAALAAALVIGLVGQLGHSHAEAAASSGAPGVAAH